MKILKLILFVILFVSKLTAMSTEPINIRFNLGQKWSNYFLEPEKSAFYLQEPFKINYDTLGFYINGEPVFIHSGEIQYFRVPEDQWEDVILKAKNGGLNCIATCVYWGIHEPKDNIWNFSGRYDIARFLSLCKKHGLYVILRIGPIINAETRNAGLPQWVRQKLPGQYNHQLYPTPKWYFDAVDDYYNYLANEVKDYFPSNGGNIVMVQLDNETNCSWIWGKAETQKDAQVTINTYQDLARRNGFEEPFTSTYWEPTHAVRAKGSIPGTGAYPLGNWHLKKTYPVFDGFKLTKTNHFEGFKDTLNYPVLSIENQGGGGYYTITPPEFPAFYNLADIASGVNATSYYIYGSGTNPQRYPGPWFNDYVGKSVARPDVTLMSYDLHSPLGEFQQIRDSYHYIRRLGLFLDSFGGTLQRLSYMNPDTITEILGKKNQVCMRQKDGSGFVFVNAYSLPCKNLKEKIDFSIHADNQTITFPQKTTLNVYQNKPLTIPFRLNINGVNFRYATVNPLTCFQDEGKEHLIFYANGNDQAEFYLEGIEIKDIVQKVNAFVFEQKDGVIVVIDPSSKENLLVIKRKYHNPVAIKVLTEEYSLKTYKLHGSPNHLFFTNLIPLNVQDGKLRFEYNTEYGTESQVEIYPSKTFTAKKTDKQFAVIPVRLSQNKLALEFKNENDGYSFALNKATLPENTKEIYLNISNLEYSKGAELYADSMMVADTYYHISGDSIFAPWSFGLMRFLYSPTQQWVVEKQHGTKDYKIFNKLSGQTIGYRNSKICMVADKDADANLWVIVKSGIDYKIQHKKTGKWLSASNKMLILSENQGNWRIEDSDDFYKTISTDQLSYISQDFGNVKVSTMKQEAKFLLKSYNFLLSLKDFTFKREEGIFAKPSHYSFLMEGNVDLRLNKQEQLKL